MPEFLFGSFRLIPSQHLLLESDKQVALGSRAMDILIALVERAGELVTKEELMARVWPKIFVEPANLTVHISGLRRALHHRILLTSKPAERSPKGSRIIVPDGRFFECSPSEFWLNFWSKAVQLMRAVFPKVSVSDSLFKKPGWLGHATAVGLTFAVKTRHNPDS